MMSGKKYDVALMIGHWGKPDHLADRGAIGEIVEAYGIVDYALALAKSLEKRGLATVLLSYGTYRERQEWANSHGIRIFFACHLNSAEKPGRYGLIRWDARGGERNKRWAERIAQVSEEALQYPWQVWRYEEGDRGFSNIRWTKMPAFLLEPAFVSGETLYLFYAHMNEWAERVAEVVSSLLNLQLREKEPKIEME